MIDSLSIINFRNYDNVSLKTEDTDLIILHGDNGEGKTNILEAISIFADGRGLRNSKFDESIKFKSEKNFWNILLNYGNDIYSCGFKKEHNKAVRIFTINDKKVRNLKVFQNNNYIIWLTYDYDRIFLESPSLRRSFIDMFINAYDAHHLDLIRDYEKLARQRLKVLKEHGVGENTARWLDVLESQIVEKGFKIALNRIKLTEILNEKQNDNGLLFIREYQNKMIGKLEALIFGAGSDDEARSLYRDALRENQQKDFFTSSTTLGPNRSDWYVEDGVKNIAAGLCSAGEQKILLCSVFFNFLYHMYKNDERNLILLMDDVIAHLDLEHRASLFKQVNFFRDYFKTKSSDIQVWMSGTDRRLFDVFEGTATFFRVANNSVEKDED